jgi:hypothetical protein
MTEPDHRRLLTAVAKLPLLSTLPVTTDTRFHSVEHRKPFYFFVRPENSAASRACLSDEPVLIALASRLVADSNALSPLSTTVTVTPMELELQIGRAHGGQSREQTLLSLSRLRNTELFTDYGPGGDRSVLYHSTLIEDLSTPSRGAWSIRLSPYLVGQVQHRQMLKPPAEYFAARGLRRRFWAICLAFCGKGRAEWQMPLPELWARTGSTDQLRKFANSLRKLIADEAAIPGFRLSLTGASRDRRLLIKRTAEALDVDDGRPVGPPPQEIILFL